MPLADDRRAVTTTKSDAFSAPMGMVNIPAFQAGSNELSIPEPKLAEAYTKLGREDLADCVRRGKVHQQLWSCIGSKPTIGKIVGLANLAAKSSDSECKVGSEEGAVVDLGRWCEVMAEKYQGNEVLIRLMGDDQLSWSERCEIKEGVEGVEGIMSSP